MTDPTDEQALAAQVLSLVHRVIRSLTLYEPNNSAVVAAVDGLEELLTAWFARSDGELKLQLLEDEAFVNGRLLKVDAAGYERASDLAQVLGRWKVGELRFAPGAGRGEVEAFVQACAQALRDGSSQLSASTFGKLAVGASQGRSMASFRFQPDRLAIWLYGSLLDLADKLYAEAQAGEAPSLLPLRRLLQMVIDSQRTTGGVFQLLTAVRDWSQPLDHNRKHAAMAVDASGFGLFLGLPNADVMTLALACLLSGLADNPEPEDAVQPLFDYPGLGVLAMPLILASYDVQCAIRGRKAGVPGLIVATIGGYHSLVGNPKMGVSPPQALAAMAAGKVRGVPAPMATLFRAYKGAWPLGTPVELSDGRRGLVADLGEDAAGAQRPTVLELGADGALGERIALAEQADLTIAAPLNPTELKLDLTAL